MKSFMNILLDGAVNDRFDEIKRVAEERNPEEWQEQQNVIAEAMKKLKEVDPKIHFSLSGALAGEQASFQEAAYFLGMADGLKISKLTDESVNKAELIYS